MPQARCLQSATLALLLTLVVAGPARGGESTERLQASDRLKARIDALDEQEEYLAEFEVAVERLKLFVPPTDENEFAFFDALIDLTSIASRGGHSSLAEELSRILLSVAVDRLPQTDVRVAVAWQRYAGSAHVFQGRGESWRALEEALCILQSVDGTETREYVKWLWGRGNWYRWKDNVASAEHLRRSLELDETLSIAPTQDIAERYVWVGWMLLHLGWHEEARNYLERGLDLHESFKIKNAIVGVALNALGDLHAIEGDWPAAEANYREATRLGEIAWRKMATTRSVPISGYNLMAFAQAKQGKFDDAWRSVQRCRIGQSIRAAVGIANWRVRDDPEYDAIQATYDKLLEKRGIAVALEEAPAIRDETWRELISQLELAARCARAEAEYVLERPVSEVTLARLQSSLDQQTAYVGWLDAKFGNQLSTSRGPFIDARWLYVVRRSGPIEWTPVYEITRQADLKAIRTPAFEFHKTISRASLWRERLDDDPELAQRAAEVYRSVFGKLPLELSGIRKVIAEFGCYDEWVHTEDLIGPDGVYVADRYAISHAPSAAIYVALAESPRRYGKKGMPAVLAIGDPVFSRGEDADALSQLDEINLRAAVDNDKASLDKLPRLPYSGREIDRVCELFSTCSVLRGEEATESTINRMLSDNRMAEFDIVHVATHALVDRMPERCAIALSRGAVGATAANNGLIHTSEIRMTWKLNAELVTLSACQTAGVYFSKGEPVGFAQALFQAGARCVLVSFWKVDDEAASLLMSRFYENVAGQGRKSRAISYSVALADAKKWLRDYRDSTGKRPFSHPVYWAGFLLIGDAG